MVDAVVSSIAADLSVVDAVTGFFSVSRVGRDSLVVRYGAPLDLGDWSDCAPPPLPLSLTLIFWNWSYAKTQGMLRYMTWFGVYHSLIPSSLFLIFDLVAVCGS